MNIREVENRPYVVLVPMSFFREVENRPYVAMSFYVVICRYKVAAGSIGKVVIAVARDGAGRALQGQLSAFSDLRLTDSTIMQLHDSL